MNFKTQIELTIYFVVQFSKFVPEHWRIKHQPSSYYNSVRLVIIFY
jgi:hypothetical protein